MCPDSCIVSNVAMKLPLIFEDIHMKTFTLDQIRVAFQKSVYAEFKDTDNDQRQSGYIHMIIGGERLSCKAFHWSRSAEQINKRAKAKSKKPSEIYPHFVMGDVDRDMLDAMERMVFATGAEGKVGDGSTSHDQAFDNRETA